MYVPSQRFESHTQFQIDSKQMTFCLLVILFKYYSAEQNSENGLLLSQNDMKIVNDNLITHWPRNWIHQMCIKTKTMEEKVADTNDNSEPVLQAPKYEFTVVF